jgi:hypothetical protein
MLLSFPPELRLDRDRGKPCPDSQTVVENHLVNDVSTHKLCSHCVQLLPDALFPPENHAQCIKNAKQSWYSTRYLSFALSTKSNAS